MSRISRRPYRGGVEYENESNHNNNNNKNNDNNNQNNDNTNIVSVINKYVQDSKNKNEIVIRIFFTGNRDCSICLVLQLLFTRSTEIELFFMKKV